jgi:hypothetical protein
MPMPIGGYANIPQVLDDSEPTQQIVVSQYKKVYLNVSNKVGDTKRNTPITGDIPLILDDDITLTLTSQFAPLMQSSDNSLFNLIGAQLGAANSNLGFSSQFEWQGFQIWKNSEPISLTLAFTFHVGMTNKNNARQEVYEPIIKLSKLPLPSLGGALGAVGNFTPPGPTLLTLTGGKKAEKASGGTLSLRIARLLYLSNVIVKRAEPTFASEFDEEGYPIWGKITLDIESVYSASQELLDYSNGQSADEVPVEIKK